MFRLDEHPYFCKYLVPINDARLLKRRLENDREYLSDQLHSGVTDRFIDRLNAKGAARAGRVRYEVLRQWWSLRKLDPIVDLICDELDNEKYIKIVLFTWFSDLTLALMRRFRRNECGAVHIYGGSTRGGKEHVTKMFKKRNTRIFVCNYQNVGKEDMDLSIAHEAIFMEPGTKIKEMKKIVERLHRDGQKKPVRIRCATTEDPLEVKLVTGFRERLEEYYLLKLVQPQDSPNACSPPEALLPETISDIEYPPLESKA